MADRSPGENGGAKVTVFQVHFGELARETIAEELKACAGLIERGIETGGWLFTRQGAGWWHALEGLEIVEASGPGPGCEREFESLTRSKEYLRDLEQMLWADGLELAGGWHTHRSGNDAPSSADMSHIESVLDLRADRGCRTKRALEVIFTPNGWGFDAHPWVFGFGESRITKTYGLQPEPAVVASGWS